MKYIKSLVALAVATSAFGAQATNLVTNGSFESTVQGSGTYGVYTTLPGWDTWSVEVRNNVAGIAQDGANFVELDTTKNSSISQNISIATAGAYQLSFWYDSRPDNGTLPTDTNLLAWTFGANSGSILNNWTTDVQGDWTNYTGTFNLAAGLVGLSFAAGGTSDSYGGSLDNVSVTLVPEPESYAMLLAGLGLMGAIARRRTARES